MPVSVNVLCFGCRGPRPMVQAQAQAQAQAQSQAQAQAQAQAPGSTGGRFCVQLDPQGRPPVRHRL